MIFLRIGRRACVCWCVLTIVAIVGAAQAGAQNSPEPPPRIPTQIILPQKLVASAPATLAVVDVDGLLVPKVTVEISGGQRVITDASGRAAFNAPKNSGMMAAQISPQGITAYAFVLAPSPAAATLGTPAPASTVRILSYPKFLSKSDKFAMSGVGFRGEADTNRVFLGDQQSFVLASSPVSLVVFPGAHVSAGGTSLSVTIAGKGSVSIPVSVVQLDVMDSAVPTNAGARGTLAVHARGTEVPLAIEVVNKSPDVVQFPQGAVQRLTTSGGKNNFAQVTTKSLKEGDYVVTARLEDIVTGQADLDSARQELVSARLSATGKWPGRIDDVIKRFDKKSPNTAKIFEALEKLRRELPPSGPTTLVDIAMQDLSRN
jgi:hypothetical protein